MARCKGVVWSGERCRNKALPDARYCGVHVAYLKRAGYDRMGRKLRYQREESRKHD